MGDSEVLRAKKRCKAFVMLLADTKSDTVLVVNTLCNLSNRPVTIHTLEYTN